MKLRLSLLFGLALTAQLVNASWHGFDPVEDGLQLASAATLAALVLALAKARSERRKALILQVRECDRLRLISRRLVETIRQSA